ncbi:MAG: GNAT family N-acetyltransferase [Hyphomonadaceae bacterium]
MSVDQAAQASILARAPTREEYERLCRAVGWRDDVNYAVAGVALDNSLFQIVAEIDGDIVGMARVVGDGAMFFYVQDVAVAPPHQGKGVGTRMIQAIRDWLIVNAPPKAQALVFEADGKRGFYQELGFEPTGKGLQAFVDNWRRE